jgi:hypothetical protein
MSPIIEMSKRSPSVILIGACLAGLLACFDPDLNQPPYRFSTGGVISISQTPIVDLFERAWFQAKLEAL